MTAPLLQLADVSKRFGAVTALRGVSFELRKGEVHALVGENGAGKSTLIRIITGAHQPDGGAIHLDGRVVDTLNPASAHLAGISAIYQQPALFPDLSVAENIALRLDKPSSTRPMRWPHHRERARTLLARVGARISVETEARDLSMPEQQLVEIASALGAGARILIMDEPTASLTSREVDLLLDLVKDLRSQGVGIIYISHRLEEVFRVADRVTVLRDGQTVGTRIVSPLRSGPGLDALTESELVRLMVGREVTSLCPPATSDSSEVLLELENVSCRASGINNVSLKVRAGEVVGMAGLVGAGRTELARVLFGITPADSGKIRVAGSPVRINSPRDAIEAGIGYVPEDRRRHGIIAEMAIAANVSLAIPGRLFPWTWLRFARERELALKYIRDLDIKAEGAETSAGTLSGGNQQKVSLARWLAAEPRVLILDEPTQGVDVGAKSEIHRFIRRLAETGMAVIMISSELPEILGMSDRIAIMRGRTVCSILERKDASAQLIMSLALGASAASRADAVGGSLE